MKRFITAVVILLFCGVSMLQAQGDPSKNYDTCAYWELIEQIRAYEDTLAFEASLPDTLRGEYGLPVTDAGVVSKVYRIYTCAALLDTLAGLKDDLDSQRNTFTCGTSTVSYDGHNYTTVLIGTQCWFKENLRTTTYRDSSVITRNLSNAAWKDYTSGAQTIYGSDGAPNHGSADTTANRNTYGRLYNWYAVSDSRGLCPTGWHVPSSTDWTTLMSNYPTDPATALKDSLPPWDGLNTSGFTARPGGWRWGGDGTYSYSTIRGYFWLSTEISSTEGAVRSMMNGSALVTDEQYAKDTGFSVRCLKD